MYGSVHFPSKKGITSVQRLHHPSAESSRQDFPGLTGRKALFPAYEVSFKMTEIQEVKFGFDAGVSLSRMFNILLLSYRRYIYFP